MKIILISFLSFVKTFALFSIVSANPTPQSQTTNPVSLTNNYFNYKSQFSEKDFEEALKDMNSSKHDNIKKEKLLTSTALYTEKFQNFSTVKSLFHIFQIKTARLKNPILNKINEQSLYPSQPLFHKIYTLPQAVDYVPAKRGVYFGTFYPMSYHRNHFKEYSRSLYHPYFHKNYDLHNSNKRFMNKRQHLDKYVIGNNVYYPDKRFTPFYPQENILLQKSLPSFLSEVTTDNTIRPYTIRQEDEEEEKLSFLNISNEKSSHKNENLNVENNKVKNVSEYLKTEILSDFSTDVATNNITLFKPVLNELLLNMKYQQKLNDKMVFNVPGDKDTAKMKSKESNHAVIIHNKRERSEPIYNTNNSKSNNLNLLKSNRVYYEKMPTNLNVSWFVYVSCSRDRCQFTNSTNETELMNEGWILHNCTSYGCREMYPETETVQKFIGLMLLVFSICILKIVAFLLVFYYCRSIKLTKNDSEEGERLIEENGPGLPFKSLKEGIEEETTSTDQPNHSGSAERVDPQLKEDNRHVSQDKSRKSNLGPPPNINSKIWIPPVQKVSPCLVAGDFLVPEKCLEKKFKMKCLNSSPKLGNRLKGSTSSLKEAKNSEPTFTMDELSIKEQNAEDGELLLMDMDEEICTDSSRSTKYTGKTSSWEILLEKECKDFINLDLNDEEIFKN